MPFDAGDPRVLILGGGPAGSSTALALARAGIDCLVVETGDGSALRYGESLPPSSRPLFARLGLWTALETGGHLPCLGNRSVWGSDSVREYDFLYSRYGSGLTLDRTDFQLKLAESARSAGARRLDRTRVTRFARRACGWLVELARDAEQAAVQPEIVVDATGRRSWFALRQGSRRVRQDAMIAAYAYLHARPLEYRDDFTLVESVERGWWYSAFIPGARVAVALMTDGDLVDLRSARSATTWLDLLNEAPHTRERVHAGGGAFAHGPVLVDASTAWLDSAAGEGWIAVGDAAASFDPLSSHGITTAVAGGQYASRAILGALDGNSAPFTEYVDGVRLLVERSCEERRSYYALEGRWRDSRFWKRRTTASSPLSRWR